MQHLIGISEKTERCRLSKGYQGSVCQNYRTRVRYPHQKHPITEKIPRQRTASWDPRLLQDKQRFRKRQERGEEAERPGRGLGDQIYDPGTLEARKSLKFLRDCDFHPQILYPGKFSVRHKTTDIKKDKWLSNHASIRMKLPEGSLLQHCGEYKFEEDVGSRQRGLWPRWKPRAVWRRPAQMLREGSAGKWISDWSRRLPASKGWANVEMVVGNLVYLRIRESYCRELGRIGWVRWR